MCHAIYRLGEPSRSLLSMVLLRKGLYSHVSHLRGTGCIGNAIHARKKELGCGERVY